MKKVTYILIFFISIVLNAQWKQNFGMPSSFANGSYLDVFFLNSQPNYGWICGHHSTTMRTENGGKTWTPVQLPGDLQLESITFLNPKVGYTSGAGMIYKSIDGGKSWKNVTPTASGGELWGNYFLDENNGWVIGGGCGNYQQFFKTTDGGLKWTLSEYLESGSKMSDLIMLAPNGDGYASGSGNLWKTSDGGKFWKPFTTSGADDWQEEITKRDSTFLVPYSIGCTGNTDALVGGVRITTNYGKTWKQHSTNAAMFGTFLLDNKRGFGVGFNKTIVYTSDAGINWEMQNCGIPEGVSLDDIWFINDTTGWVVGIGVYEYHPFKQSTVTLNLDGTVAICGEDSVVLSTKETFKKYRWSNGATTASITVKKAGTYSVYVEKEFICDSVTSKPIKVELFPKPDFTIQSSSNIDPCEGDSVILTISKDFKSFKWNVGDSTKSIKVRKSGKYSVTVIDSNGCVVEKSYEINFFKNPKPPIRLSKKPNICIGDSVSLSTDNIYATYEWYFSDNNLQTVKNVGDTYTIAAKDSGNYFLIVRNDKGCINYSDTILVTVRLDTNKISLVLISNQMNLEFGRVKFPVITCKDVEIKNNSWKDLKLDDIYFFKNLSFSIPLNQMPLVIQPGKTVKLQVCYSPKKIGTENDTLLIIDNCGEHLLPAFGFGYNDTLRDDTKCNIKIELIPIGINGSFIVQNSYPNPANNELRTKIQFIKNKDAKLDLNAELFNTYGEKVADATIGFDNIEIKPNYDIYSSTLNFDTSRLESDKYFVKITFDGVNYFQPIIVIH